MEQSDVLPTGTLVDRYKIESVLGIGGFGITYKAIDTRLHGYVAIKEFLPGTLANRDGATKTVVPKSHSIDIYSHCLNAFVDEARRLNQLHHPNVVGVLNFVEQYGTAYIVMKFEEGESMDLSLKRMKGTSVAENDIMTVLVPILKGLKAVHDAGMLHRDIKPGNIFIRDNGEPMLIDFGAARQEVGGHTKTMTAMVSMGFAPPEQYSSEGKRQGTWSDIYAVGAVAYQMITGTIPVDATERQTALFDNEPDPLTPLSQHPKAKEYSRTLVSVIESCLQVSAKARPQNVSDILIGLSINNKPDPSSAPIYEQLKAKNIKPKLQEKHRFSPMAILFFAVFGAIAMSYYFFVHKADDLAQQQSQNALNTDEMAWKEALDSEIQVGWKAAFTAYLNKYPSGKYANEALIKMRDGEFDSDYSTALANKDPLARIVALNSLGSKWNKKAPEFYDLKVHEKIHQVNIAIQEYTKNSQKINKEQSKKQIELTLLFKDLPSGLSKGEIVTLIDKNTETGKEFKFLFNGESTKQSQLVSLPEGNYMSYITFGDSTWGNSMRRALTPKGNFKTVIKSDTTNFMYIAQK